MQYRGSRVDLADPLVPVLSLLLAELHTMLSIVPPHDQCYSAIANALHCIAHFLVGELSSQQQLANGPFGFGLFCSYRDWMVIDAVVVEHQKRLNKQRNELERLLPKLKRPNLERLMLRLEPMRYLLEKQHR